MYRRTAAAQTTRQHYDKNTTKCSIIVPTET